MTFASGTTSINDMLCLNIAIADDDAYEEDELFTFLITSASPPSAVAIGASQAVKTIQDNNGITKQGSALYVGMAKVLPIIDV